MARRRSGRGPAAARLNRAGSRALAPAVALLLLWLAWSWTLRSGLGHDVRFEIGTQSVSPYAPVGTFTHRPMLYRVLMSGWVPVRRDLPDVASFELAMRAGALVLCVLVAVLVWWALRRHRVPGSAALALATAVPLALAGGNTAWEPEWLASVVTATAVALTLLPRRRWIGVWLGGLLFFLAAGLKVVTLPLALAGLLVVLLLDRGRALRATAAAAVSGVIYLALTAWLWPQEIRWFVDGLQLNPDSTLPERWERLLTGLGNAVVMWPLLLLVPAALALTRARRLPAAVAAVLLVAAPAVIQNQYYPYHLHPLAVLAAVLVVLSVRRGGLLLPLLSVPLSLLAWWAMTQPEEWRADQAELVYSLLPWAALLGLGAALAVQELQHHARPGPAGGSRHRWLAGLAAGAAVLASAPSTSPTSGWSFDDTSADMTSLLESQFVADQERLAARAHQQIGPGSEVVYLTYGDTPYFLGNPTRCRFPSPSWLYRGRWLPAAQDTPTYADNLRCLSIPSARWLVVKDSWIDLDEQPAALVRAVEDNFDCDSAFGEGGFRYCPRRE